MKKLVSTSLVSQRNKQHAVFKKLVANYPFEINLMRYCEKKFKYRSKWSISNPKL